MTYCGNDVILCFDFLGCWKYLEFLFDQAMLINGAIVIPESSSTYDLMGVAADGYTRLMRMILNHISLENADLLALKSYIYSQISLGCYTLNPPSWLQVQDRLDAAGIQYSYFEIISAMITGFDLYDAVKTSLGVVVYNGTETWLVRVRYE